MGTTEGGPKGSARRGSTGGPASQIKEWSDRAVVCQRIRRRSSEGRGRGFESLPSRHGEKGEEVTHLPRCILHYLPDNSATPARVAQWERTSMTRRGPEVRSLPRARRRSSVDTSTSFLNLGSGVRFPPAALAPQQHLALVAQWIRARRYERRSRRFNSSRGYSASQWWLCQG